MNAPASKSILVTGDFVLDYHILATKAEDEVVRQRIEHNLDLLAEAEHEGWMKWHFAQGWRYSPKRDDDKKQHDCLLPFSKLKDNDKNKDREQVRHYMDFLVHVGWGIAVGKGCARANTIPQAVKPRPANRRRQLRM